MKVHYKQKGSRTTNQTHLITQSNEASAQMWWDRNQ